MILKLIIFEIVAIATVTRHIDIAPTVVLTFIIWVIMYLIKKDAKGDL